MCKTWKIKYTCIHIFPFRLSTCNGTFTRFNKPSADCGGWSYLTLLSNNQCGACQKAPAVQALTESTEKLKADAADDSDQLAAIEAQDWHETCRLNKAYFGKTSKKQACPQHRPKVDSQAGSPLKHEVRPEDVVLKQADDITAVAEELTAEDAAWYASWNTPPAALPRSGDEEEEEEEPENEQADTSEDLTNDSGLDSFELVPASVDEKQDSGTDSTKLVIVVSSGYIAYRSNLPVDIFSVTTADSMRALEVISVVPQSRLVEATKHEAGRIVAGYGRELEIPENAKANAQLRELLRCFQSWLLVSA